MGAAPWGWHGIDQYHQLAIDLSQGRGFATLDVPWAYGYFLAFFYRLFGPTPLPALLMQNLLNASIPVVVYCYAVRAFDRRVAMVAAAMVGLLSFNTIYVSTESTDSVYLPVHADGLVVRPWAQQPQHLVVRGGWRAGRHRRAVQAQSHSDSVRALRPQLANGSAVVAASLARRCDRAHGRTDVGPVDDSQLPPDRPGDAHQHSRRYSAVVRHAADRQLPREPVIQPQTRVRDTAVRLQQPD